MASRGLVVLGVVCTMAAVRAVAGCSTFTEETTPPLPEASVPLDADTNEGGGGGADASDATAPPTDAGAPAKLCPPPSGGPRTPTTWLTRPLYMPAASTSEYPWGIAVHGDVVAWIAQTAAEADTAYNGHGVGTVRWVSKQGTAPHVIATDQPQATEIVIDGTDLVWTTHDTAHAFVFAQSMTCEQGTCAKAPSLLLQLDGPTAIVRLVRVSPGLLFVQRDGGAVYAIDRSVPPLQIPIPVFTTGKQPWITATDDAVYAVADGVGSLERYDVLSRNIVIDRTMPMLASPGAYAVATDCKSVFVARKTTTGDAIFAGAMQGSVFGTTGTAASQPIYDLAADDRYLYAAEPNPTGGLVVTPSNGAGAPAHLSTVGVFRVAVDSEGVYWGEHPATGAGTIRMAVK